MSGDDAQVKRQLEDYISAHSLDTLYVEAIEKTLIVQPEDPAAFCVAYLYNRYAERMPEGAAIMAAGHRAALSVTSADASLGQRHARLATEARARQADERGPPTDSEDEEDDNKDKDGDDSGKLSSVGADDDMFPVKAIGWKRNASTGWQVHRRRAVALRGPPSPLPAPVNVRSASVTVRSLSSDAADHRRAVSEGLLAHPLFAEVGADVLREVCDAPEWLCVRVAQCGSFVRDPSELSVVVDGMLSSAGGLEHPRLAVINGECALRDPLPGAPAAPLQATGGAVVVATIRGDLFRSAVAAVARRAVRRRSAIVTAAFQNLGGLYDHELEALGELLVERRCPPGHSVVRVGALIKGLFVCTQGSGSVRNDGDVVLGSVGVGFAAGDTAFLDLATPGNPLRWRASVVAGEDGMTILGLDKARADKCLGFTLAAVIRRDPEVLQRCVAGLVA